MVKEIAWEAQGHFAVDFFTDQPVLGGYTTILVVDRLSKGHCFFPFKLLPSALQAAEALFQFVFCVYGILKKILFDRGTQFVSRIWKSFHAKLRLTISLTSSY